MFLEFDDEQLELRDSARAALARLCPPLHTTADPDTPPAATDAGGRSAVDTEVAWLGWPALAIDIDHGGLGRSFVELAVVLEELGRAAAPGAFLATTTQFAPVVREAGTAAQARRFLGGVASGDLTGTLAVHESGRWQPDTVTASAARDGDGWLLRGHKQHVLAAPAIDEVVVSARRDDGPLGMFVVPADELTFKRIDNVDVTRAMANVELDGVWVPDARLLGEPATDGGTPLERALSEATVGLALDALGACSALVDAAQTMISHGVAGGQAAEHALGDMIVAVETTRAAVYESVAAVAEHEPSAGVAASVAKAASGACRHLVTQRCLEIHSNAGARIMAALRRWTGRAVADDLLFGASTDHRRIVADRVLSHRSSRGAQDVHALLA